MTEQAVDRMFYQGRKYQLVYHLRHTATLLQEWGIPRFMVSTACVRSYVANYEIDENQLLLTRLLVAYASAPQDIVETHVASVMEKLPPIGEVYPETEFAGYAYSTSTKDWKQENLLSYNIFYKLKHFYDVDCQFTVFYREDGEYVSPYGLTPHAEKIIKITIESGYLREMRDVTEEYESIQQHETTIYEERRKLPRHEQEGYRAQDLKALFDQRFNLLWSDSVWPA